MVPLSPTAHNCVPSLVPKTEKRLFVVPLLCASQLWPPSLVCRMVPLAPTAQPERNSTDVVGAGLVADGLAETALCSRSMRSLSPSTFSARVANVHCPPLSVATT